jgi:hypothetical protein
MVWNREDYINHMTFNNTGKELFCELFGPLVGLPEQWAAQGASEDEINLSAFGWESVNFKHVSGYTGAITGIEQKILEETDEYIISSDYKGRKNKLFKKSATIP